MDSRQHRQLFEFPSVLLPAFPPPLKALQTMSQKLDLPFQNLLTLHAGDQQVTIAPPLYSKRPGFSFDLTCLSNDGPGLSYTPGSTPDPAGLSQHSSLDLTQAKAILNCLNRSLALIQGPPGTGKSYTGEALIKVLLANKSKAKLGPIMCVCYTNHALDQLLEHLVDGGVKNIVRIGSRSKSERLGPVNLRQVVKDMTRTKMEGKALYESIEALDSDASYVLRRLEAYQFLNTSQKIWQHLDTHHPRQCNELFGHGQYEDDGWQTVRTDRRSRKKAIQTWLRGGSTANRPARPVDQLYRSKLWEMTHQERIIMYQDWMADAFQTELDTLSAAHESYERKRERNNRVRSSIDLRCLQQANIIGVTTTGLATNLDLLRRVHGKVLLCEEAGEVLEAHLLTALLPTIEHAILIGDHLQLRPQIQDWRLQRANPAGVKYSLDVSLFERLVQPSTPGTPALPFSVLDTQRRMHPSISELVRSTLYPSLADSDAVQAYPAVCGMAKRLFWLHHESPESGRKSDQESVETSYSNDFEVDMVSSLVSHLLRQGVYKAGEIAVLTPYLGQLNKLRQKLGSTMQIVINDRDLDVLADMESPDGPAPPGQQNHAARSSALQGVRAATVDNFQGEDANVVIISLVRSNSERRCGFLSASNRINVLLSRARHGMYIIGNSHTSSHVSMWAQVINILQQGGNIGKQIELQCPRHPKNKSMVSQPEDFIQLSPDGGCNRPCDRRLNCGHSCAGPCHSDTLHNALKCLEDCARPKEHCNHPCRKRCGEPCGKLCMELLLNAGLKLPCGHILNKVECWRTQDPAAVRCAVQVEKSVPGCDHKVRVPCHVDVTSARYLCQAGCGFQRPCGHMCKGRCNGCRRREQGEIVKEEHGLCQHPCGRDYTSCSHRCRAPCHDRKDCPPCPSPCQNQCVHSKCAKQCHEPCAPCAEETCSSCCPHSKCSMPCAAPCDWIPCTKRCTKVLECNHQCPSVCREKCSDKKFCQECASDDIKHTVVDLIMLSDYRSVNLNEEPCIFPDCRHFLTYSSMDGQMGLRDFYDVSTEGIPTAIKSASHPFDLSQNIKVCANCRSSLRNVSRYVRIVRRGLLDESTKRFISWSNMKWNELSGAFLAAREELEAMDKNGLVFPARHSEEFNLQGARHEQIQHLFTSSGLSRHKTMKKVRRQIASFLELVRKDEQPYQRVAHLVWHVNRRRQKGSSFAFDESTIQMGSHLQAMSLLLRCDLLLVSDFVALCRDSSEPRAKSVKVEIKSYIRDCERLLKIARTRKHVRQEVEGHMFFAMFCSLVSPGERKATSEGAGAHNAEDAEKEAKHLGQHHLEVATDLMDKHPSTAVLKPELERVWRTLRDGVFYTDVSVDELREVYQAMAQEFSGTGHWYRCLNGHPFTTGECGMAMELARCPECGGPVGGSNHQSVEGVQHAHDIEQLGTGVGSLRI
ncbi:hypothetical protein CSOJ01_10269 [Colletotrichum sojae]|uniref:RZ-type domain-containing protein n=1 Tax=Colletotrichum sojae TaxID=2175907 RepID=A0A8H6J1J3_9PEZI|nr:hypothetical protein CSOJ01_10269 [Colletotrichum sojae]